VKVYLLFSPYPVCGAARNECCRDLVTSAPTMTFHSARVAAAGE
jgi:hypothetical protein